MKAIIAKLKVKSGSEAAFEEVAKRLVAAVNANEPGCLFYALHKSGEPGRYIFLERYADEAAIEAHRKTTHYREIGREMGAYMEGRPEVEILDEVT